ncbi:MAG: ABC transporter permease [Ancalomicrobiaceae bacterium]|nr:ABC transporter permease [Ancalomicrobiaceae bacterium]
MALALVLIVDALISPGFFNVRIVQGRLFGNVIDIFYRAMPTAMVALGMAVVIGTKGIDLSVGSIIAICGAIIAWRMHQGDSHFVILLMALAAGLACGLWNGFLVSVLEIQPIIATLILMVSGRGIGLMVNLLYGGTNPSFTSPLLQGLSVGSLGLIPTRLIVGAVIFFLLWLLVRRTAFGLFLESVGGNAKSARLAGVNARFVLLSAYLISGFLAATAGVILTADTHTSDPVSVASNIELDAILAVVIGGGSLAGGRIFLDGTIIGVLVIQALTTSILTSGLPPEYNLVVKAVVVLIVLLLQSSNMRAAVVSVLVRRKA